LKKRKKKTLTTHQFRNQEVTARLFQFVFRKSTAQTPNTIIMKTKMFGISFLLLLSTGISLFFLPSCEKLKEATTFKIKVDLPDGHYNLKSITQLKSEQVLFSQSSSINIDSIVGARNGLVEGVSFYKLRFSITSPETAKLNWLDSARVRVSSEGGTPVDIATSPTINAGDRSIDFVVKDVDVLKIVKKPFTITLLGNLNGNMPILPMEVLLESGIEITISPL